MEEYIFHKNYFGRDYTFIQVHKDQILDMEYIENNRIDGVIFAKNEVRIVDDIKNISEFRGLKALDLNSYYYEKVSALSNLEKIEFLKILGGQMKRFLFLP